MACVVEEYGWCFPAPAGITVQDHMAFKYNFLV